MEDCQSFSGSCPQRVGAEHREYGEVSSSSGMTFDKSTSVCHVGLLERVVNLDNMRRAYSQVWRNRGAAGVDGMAVGVQMREYFASHSSELFEQVYRGEYRPLPVRRVEIPKKEKGKVRKLGIPTVVDRVVQQAIAQVLTPIYEPVFHGSSWGFRPGRGAHGALLEIKSFADQGFVWVVDMDLEKFFDTVCQSKLVQVLSGRVKDGRLISLIHKYLRAGVMTRDGFESSDVGMPQGGPLSPVLSNVMLNELDWELDRRGLRFVRYADDCMILCKSRRAAERVLESVTRFIEDKLFLKVNREKTTVAHISRVKFLGYGFYRYRGVLRFRVHPKSVASMKDRVRAITARSKPIPNLERPGMLTRFVRGWVQYFKLADMNQLLVEVDQWMRRRIRMLFWKQWKRVRTRYSRLRSLGCAHEQAFMWACTRRAYWRIAGSPVLAVTLTNQRLLNWGFPSFVVVYQRVRAV